MGLPAHAARDREYTVRGRKEDPASWTITQTGFDRAVEIAGDEGADAKSRHDSMSHLRRCLEQGVVGYSPITNDQRVTIAQIAYRMANADHWLERRAGLTALESMESRNLNLATAIDKAQRLDQGTPTEIKSIEEKRAELHHMIVAYPELQQVVRAALEGGGGPPTVGGAVGEDPSPYSSEIPENE